MDINCNFLLNKDYLSEIDITPELTTATWARIGKGINAITPATNEELSQEKYMDGDGWGETDVIGAQYIITHAGHRAYGDSAQDYIFGTSFAVGCARKTQHRLTFPDGTIVTKPCTIANITQPNGAPAAKGDISFEIHYNGKPSETKPSAAPALSATFAGGSVSGSTSFTATPDANNTLAYRKYDSTQPATPVLATVPYGLTAYTSGDDILDVTAGDYIIAYELSQYGRVVKADVYELQAIDVTT